MSIYLNYLSHLLDDQETQETFQREGLEIIPLARGVIRIKGESSCSPLVLSCGIHGNETAPIEILNDILKDIALGKIHPQRELLLIFGHIEAMREHKRFIDFNMNRLFLKNYRNHPEARESKRAQELEEIMAEFFKDANGNGKAPWHLDLHTAIKPSHHTRFAVFPKQDNGTPTQGELSLLTEFGIDAILLANGSANTFSSHSCETHEALAYTLELGKVYPFGENPHEQFTKAKSGLIQFIEGDDILSKNSTSPIMYSVEKELIKDHENYQLLLDDNYANFTPLPKGHELERLKDGIFILKEEMAVVFPNNNVPLGERTGLLVKKLNN